MFEPKRDITQSNSFETSEVTTTANCATLLQWPYTTFSYPYFQTPPTGLNIRSVENGYIINFGGKEYVAVSLQDVAIATKKLLKETKESK